MENNRNTKLIAIVGLIAAILALSIGFAAFTQSLSISTNAVVNPENTTLDILFSSSSTSQLEDNVTPSTSDIKVIGTPAVIVNDGAYPTISNLHATFTDKNQTVTYSFYVHNNSAYVGYLRGVTYSNATGASTYKRCIAGEETTESTVNNSDGGAACDDISMTISINNNAYASTNTAISSTPIAIDEYQPIVVTITYSGTHDLPDGDFDVSFGDITLNYSSIDKKTS